MSMDSNFESADFYLTSEDRSISQLVWRVYEYYS